MRRWRQTSGGRHIFPNIPMVPSSATALSFLAILLLSSLLQTSIFAQQPGEEERAADENELYILLDEISVFSCRGVKNEIKLTEEVSHFNHQENSF